MGHSGRLGGPTGAPGDRFDDILRDFGVPLGNLLVSFWRILENSMRIEFLRGLFGAVPGVLGGTLGEHRWHLGAFW